MKLFILSLLSGLSLAACSSSITSDHPNSLKPEKVFVLSFNQVMQQSVKVGDIFLVEMASNPSTGYRWAMTNRRDGLKCIQLKKEQAFPASSTAGSNSPSNIVGAPGKQQWQFIAKCAGDVQVRFEYRRSWEAKSTPAPIQAQLNLRIQ